MKRLFTLIVILTINLTLFSQAPQKLSYQAVIRNSSGGLVTGHAVGMRISILQGSESGTPVYVETHTTTTNANGLATIQIGGGTVVSGTFASINWGSGTFYLKTETDPDGGTSFTITGTSQLLSVPYALYARQVEIGSSQWSESGSDIYFNTGKVGIGKIPGSDKRQFQVSTGDNQAIAGVNNSTLGTIFGQNLGSGPAGDFRNKLLIVDGTQGAGKVLTSDAAGYTSWQSPEVVTDASFTGTGTAASPLKLSSFGAATGQVLKWTGSAWDNAADDDGPWTSTTNYIYNQEIKKFGMGISVPTQKLTIAEGGASCYMNLQNSSTGFTSSDGLTLGLTGVDGILTNVENGKLFLGTNNTVKMTILPNGNAGIGTAVPAFKLDVAGDLNLNKGVSTGIALWCNSDEALWYNGTYFSWGYGGTWNFFGDKVFIGAVATDPGTNLLVVNGTAAKPGGGSWATWSDSRLKDIHGNYSKGLKEIIALHPVSFSYRKDNSLKLPDDKVYAGLVAQDVQSIFPEAVSEGTNGYLQLDNNSINIALINAVRELKAENDELKLRLSRLEAKIGK